MKRDEILYETIEQELQRQRKNIELIASENFVSKQVLDIAGSILTNKYAEGYPNQRYYGGCEYIDKIEQLAIDRLKEIFHAQHANVQPHSGSQANMAVYQTILEHGDKVLGMSLNDGGHLTHGHPLNFSGKSYTFYGYGVDKTTEMINYEEVARIAREVKPKLIIAGASAYARIIDFKKFRDIADEVGAYLMVDMAHIAGLIAAGVHPSPIPYADFVTTTTHKTLRGPRGGAILCKKEYAQKLDKSVFPGMQGGPLEHIIAAKAACFGEVLEEDFKEYAIQIVKNAKVLAKVLIDSGFRVISNGTDNHMVLVDVKQTIGITGKKAEQILDSIYITCNKNSIPFDTEKPMLTSGIRLGTPAMTTRGFKEEQFKKVGEIIVKALQNYENEVILNECKKEVEALTKQYELYQGLTYIK